VSQGVPRCQKVAQGVLRCHPKVSECFPRCPKVSEGVSQMVSEGVPR
jgi:hypothetical protein